MKNLGELVKEWREAAGMKPADVAGMVRAVAQTKAGKSVQRQHIEQLELVGTRTPRYLPDLARAMGTTSDNLLALIPPPLPGRPGPADLLLRRFEVRQEGVGGAHGRSNVPSDQPSISRAAAILARALVEADEMTRESLAPLLSRLARNPEEGAKIGRMMEALLGASPREAAPEVVDPTGHRPSPGEEPGDSQLGGLDDVTKPKKPAGGAR